MVPVPCLTSEILATACKSSDPSNKDNIIARYIRTGRGSGTPLAVARAKEGSEENPLGALYVRIDLHGVL